MLVLLYFISAACLVLVNRRQVDSKYVNYDANNDYCATLIDVGVQHQEISREVKIIRDHIGKYASS